MTTSYLTLADYANDARPLVAGVAKLLRENSRFMDILPFANVGALNVKVVREGGMPSLSWREIGAAHSSAKATKPDEIQERVYSIGNIIGVDKMYMRDTSPRLYNPMTYQTSMTVKSIARHFSDAAINGLPTDETKPVGLWYRVNNDLASTQKINGNGVDISSDGASLSTAINTFFDLLDETLYTVTDSFEDAGNVYLLCNDTMIQRYQSIARQSGLLSVTTDAIGRTFNSYKGAKFVDMGRKYDDSTRIIGNAETDAGTALTGGDATSIYAVRVGPEYLTGWQEYGLEVSAPQLDQTNQVLYYSVIDWAVGLALSHPRHSLAQLHGIVAA